MNRPALEERIKDFEAGRWRRRPLVLIPILALGLFYLFFPLFGMPIREFDAVHWLRMFLTILWYGGFMWLSRKLNRQSIERLELRCPECRTPMIGKRGEDAIAYHVCGQCGASLKAIE